MEPTTGWTERKLSPSYFPRFPFRPPCRRFHLAPSPRSSPQAISHGFPPVHLHLAPCHRSSPQAISHGFPSVHPIVASISLLPRRALPKLFPTVPFRSFLTELSPCYFPPFPFHPPCRRFRSSPEAISHEISFPSTLSSLPYRSFSLHAISHGFPSVHLVITSASLLPNGSDGRVEGRGNSLGRVPLGRSDTEATIYVDGGATVGNSLGRALLGRSDTEATTRWTEGNRGK